MTRAVLAFGLAMAACSGGGERPANAAGPADAAAGDAHIPIDGGPMSERVVCADAGACAVPEPAWHMADRGECSLARMTPELGRDPSPMSECLSHEDCTAGNNGRCSGINASIWRCSYDECFTDADCADGMHCACGASTDVRLGDGGYERERHAVNRCTPGDCASDADCGGASYCSPSTGPVLCSSASAPRRFARGDFCRSPRDACIDDTDCDSRSLCAFNPDAARWECFEDCVE